MIINIDNKKQKLKYIKMYNKIDKLQLFKIDIVNV